MYAKRHPLQVRLSDSGHRWIEELRREHDVTAADVMRAALAVAARHRDEVRTHLRTMKGIG